MCGESKAKWIPCVMGEANSRTFEISVVRQDNAHGLRSYGWFHCDEKRLITHSGGPCDWTISEFVWGRAVETAKAYAEYLNYQESGICQ